MPRLQLWASTVFSGVLWHLRNRFPKRSAEVDRVYYTFISSPVGLMLLGGDLEAVSMIEFGPDSEALGVVAEWELHDEPFKNVSMQLDEYFKGVRHGFDFNFVIRGTTFQLNVLDALRTIPYGETRTYGEIALQIGKPGAFRAVGAVCRRNPLPIVIPCHRVIGQNGALTGFRGGLGAKRYLLALESRYSRLSADDC